MILIAQGKDDDTLIKIYSICEGKILYVVKEFRTGQVIERIFEIIE